MRYAILKSRSDLAWLHDVHGVDIKGVKLAVIHGNEDSPERVELFERDHYQCVPVVVRFLENAESQS